MIGAITAIIIVGASCFVVGMIIGYDRGTMDTEKRWSDAVARADDRRKHGS